MPHAVVNPFSPRGAVSRGAYLAWGCGLAAAKYAAEAIFVAATSGRTLGPGEFLSPSLDRLTEFERLGDWAGPAYVLWTLPFVFVCAALSVRRAATAGLSPWLGLLSLAPFLNLAVIGLLAALPTAARPEPPAARTGRPDDPEAVASVAARNRTAAWAAGGVLFGPVYTVTMVYACVYVLKDYGAPLFFLTPVLVGAAAGYCANAVRPVGSAATLGAATLAALASYGGLLVIAWEGLVCLLMALPLALPLALIGGVIGGANARLTRPAARDGDGDGGTGGRGFDPGAAACLALAPVGSVLAPADAAPVRPVTTAVVVNAPPAVVWEHVLAFPPLPEPTEWYFETGLAYPVGATIVGAGVGAVRRCRFSTGTFVEPITAWRPPAGGEPGRLAFDVAEQPEPMTEWHPWAEIAPPHLHGTFESVRGEFLLEPLPGNRTRLTGTTWRRVKMGPQAYWAAWTDAILHRVHRRVLGHVGALAEADARP